MALEKKEGSVTFPELLWGLDPMFRNCNKMYVMDVLSMPEMDTYSGKPILI